MRIFVLFFSALMLFSLLVGTPAQANALCKGKPRISLNDGSKACVLDTELSTVTYTRGIVGRGPAAERRSKRDIAAVVVNFYAEPNNKKLSEKVQEARATAVCAAFKDELLAQVKRPGSPFMMVVLSWGSKPGAKDTRRDTLNYFYFTKGCGLRSGW